MKNKIQTWWKTQVYRFIGWVMPEVIHARNREIIRDTAMRSVMAYLDKEGFSHCSFCERRFQIRVLKKEKGVKTLACPKHYDLFKKIVSTKGVQK